MGKSTVNYRDLRLSNITSPQYRHIFLLLVCVSHYVIYAITEALIDPEKCHVIHHTLDDMIPFCEWFVIPYVFWYFFLFSTVFYFLFCDVESFKRLMIYALIVQVIGGIIFVLYPSRQDLRPEYFIHDNPLTRCVALLYRSDTNTNVLPSMHVAYSITIASVWLHKKQTSIFLKIGIAAIALLICLSTVFIKQHSVLDGFVAIGVCLVAEFIVFFLLRGKIKS